VRGQEKAIRELSSAISAAEIGLFSRERPRGIFLILGERGCGKTLLAKELSNIIASKKSELIRYDMSEFREPSSISKLIGSPPGYVGYQDGGTLTELVRRHPYSVILFDEIEKADRDVQNLILQMLSEGIMHDNTGKSASFKDTYIIFTSNLSPNHSSQSGFVTSNKFSEKLTPPREFSEEFISRMDRVVYLSELCESSLFEIGKDALNKIRERLFELGVSIEWSDELPTFFAKEAKQDKCGARSLSKIIKTFFEENVLDYLTFGCEGKIYCTVKDGTPQVEFEKARVAIY
jgi:ATP-dependent Clp protease ATP-binding subunit ClpA